MGKSSESVQCTMLKACDACTDMGQLWRTVLIRKTFQDMKERYDCTIGTLDVLKACDACADMGQLVQCADCVVFP